MEGLCGNFDGDTNDDFLMLDSPALFAARWKTSPTCPDSHVPEDYEPCRVRTPSGGSTLGPEGHSLPPNLAQPRIFSW